MFRVENLLFMSLRRIQMILIKTMTNRLSSTTKHVLTVNMEQANILGWSVGINIILSQSFVHATRTTLSGFRRLMQTNMIDRKSTRLNSKHVLTVNMEEANMLGGSVGISIILSQSFVHATRTTPSGFRRLMQTNMIQNNLTICVRIKNF